MPINDPDPRSERHQTNESLRVEREKVDDAFGAELTSIDDLADAVICRARARADELLATARARSDRQSPAPLPSARIERERVREDQALRQERSEADEAVREERAEHKALLSLEREETDKDLSAERARSDDAIATRDEFLGLVGHDLRNMMNAVVGHAELIEAAVARDNHTETILAHARSIRRSGARMERVIGDLVDVASIEAGRLALFREVGEPATVVTEAVDAFLPQAAARGVSLATELVPPPSLARFDPTRILQVLANFLSNAIKFSRKGDRVVVRVERLGDAIRFAVGDSGEGIPAGKLEDIFERFHQVAANDRRGVGLGLYISKCIVEAHGGRIWAESSLGEGSTFFFTLPTHVAAVEK